MNAAILEDIKIKILPILKKADIKKAAIFGSYVRGDNTKKAILISLLNYLRTQPYLSLEA